MDFFCQKKPPTIDDSGGSSHENHEHGVVISNIEIRTTDSDSEG
jgi:hypothetical protein